MHLRVPWYSRHSYTYWFLIFVVLLSYESIKRIAKAAELVAVLKYQACCSISVCCGCCWHHSLICKVPLVYWSGCSCEAEMGEEVNHAVWQKIENGKFLFEVQSSLIRCELQSSCCCSWNASTIAPQLRLGPTRTTGCSDSYQQVLIDYFYSSYRVKFGTKRTRKLMSYYS